MTHLGQLAIPSEVAADRDASELVRVWVSRGQQHVVLRVGAWPDPAAWGLALVDLAKHVDNSYAQERKVGVDGVLRRIKEGLDAEWSSPTDVPTGVVLE